MSPRRRAPDPDSLTVVCPVCSREQTLEGSLARSAVTLGRFTCERCSQRVIPAPKPRIPARPPRGTAGDGCQ